MKTTGIETYNCGDLANGQEFVQICGVCDRSYGGFNGATCW